MKSNTRDAERDAQFPATNIGRHWRFERATVWKRFGGRISKLEAGDRRKRIACSLLP